MASRRSGLLYPYRTAPIVDLLPYVNNARTHSDAQVAQIAASIREFGFTNPVLIDGENGIIAGHGRVLAARKLDMAEVPVIELKHLTKSQRRAYILADNRLALNAGFDNELLKLELSDLKAEGFDIGLIGFSGFEIDVLCAEDLSPGEKNNAEKEWQGMPEFNQEDQTPIKTISVHFQDEQAIAQFASMVCQTITESTKSIWYPKIEREDIKDKAWETE